MWMNTDLSTQPVGTRKSKIFKKGRPTVIRSYFKQLKFKSSGYKLKLG